MTTLLTFEQLNLTIDGKALLINNQGAINQGDKIALIGQSGSGKSLFLQVLADLLPLDLAAVMKFQGQNVNQITPSLYREKVTLIHQEISLISGTVLDNLTLPFGFKHHKNKTADLDFYIKNLHYLGKSADFLDKDVSILSGGEKQLVNIIRSLQFFPTILLCDEITSALDPQTADKVIDLILSWHSSNTAFVWVTHTPEQITKLKAKTWQIKEGILYAG